jgi:NAD(P)-dependent dehydrogenase (short-subunit alcohol dehydrogenase family)
MKLKNKIAVISGGNSGIGRGIAKCFIDEGAKVIIFGRNSRTLDETKAELGEKLYTIQCDVGQADNLKNMYQEIQDDFGKIDILVANAGIVKRAHIAEITENNFHSVIDINLKGLFFTVKYSLDTLCDGGVVLLIASAAAYKNVKNHSVYSCTKAAVVKLAENFANDLAERNIRVNSISPGIIKTPIFDERLKNDPDFLEKREARIPLKRLGHVDDIAKAATFLCSDDASYITGTDLLVDGGYAKFERSPLE